MIRKKKVLKELYKEVDEYKYDLTKFRVKQFIRKAVENVIKESSKKK